MIDTDGEVRYEQVAERVDDRTYGNWVRYSVRNDFEDPFGEWSDDGEPVHFGGTVRLQVRRLSERRRRSERSVRRERF